MIAFATFFLGLVAGPQVVEVVVSSQVATVEISLDGKHVATLRKNDPAPWRAEIDFGERLTRHELLAIAFDAHSLELARAHQLLNHSRQNVAAELLLDDWQDGSPRAARVVWQSADSRELLGLSVSLDGARLEPVEAAGFELPPTDPSKIHFLTADLALDGQQTTTAEVVFGGRFQDSVPAELTALALSGLPNGRRAHAAAHRRIRSPDGQQVSIVAIDHGPAELVFVRSEDAQPWLEELDLSMRRKSRGHATFIDKQDHLVIMSARPRPSDHPERKYSLFPVSPRFSAQDYSIPRALGGVGFVDLAPSPERLTNAVAVAGLQAAALKRRRVVVLLTSKCDRPSGSWSVPMVRDYLRELSVPMVVWQFGGGKKRSQEGFCAGARHIASDQVYVHEIRKLLAELEAQDIVWIEGPGYRLTVDSP